MPETYGIPDPEPEPIERVERAAKEAIAGNGIVRTVLLYVAVALLAVSPVPVLAIVPLVLLLATDTRLA